MVRNSDSEPQPAASGRIHAAWQALGPAQHWAVLAAGALIVSMILPWYLKSAPTAVDGQLITVTKNLTAFSVFTGVEGSLLLVAVSVLLLLFARAEESAFHLPGGDGPTVVLAGLWSAGLIVYRMVEQPTFAGAGVTVEVQWGIFLALAAAVGLAYAGVRIRIEHRPEPPLAKSEE